MLKNNQLFKTILVIGDNPDEIINKYSADNVNGKQLYLRRNDAENHRQNKIKLLKESLNNNSSSLTEQQKSLTIDYINILSEMTDLDYFLDITEGCTYDENTGDAYKAFNPNAFYKSVRSPQKVFEEYAEESGFCNPFKLFDDYISYSAEKKDIDWSRNHLFNKHVYEITWDMVVNGMKPRNEAENTIYENMKNRKGYFKNFKDKDDFVNYSTSFWTYGIATEEKYEDADEIGIDMNSWIKNFYDNYIKNLPDNTLLTIYEVQSI